MYSTQLYLYQQIAQVLLIATGDGETFDYRWNPVYAKPLTINLGVDNVILFQFLNQEQKPVNITGSTITFRLIDQEGSTLLLTAPVVILNAATGRAKVTIPASEMITFRAQPANYSLTFSNSDLIQPVFTDAKSGARAPVNLVDSVYPEFIPSAELTIPTNRASNQLQYGGSGYDGYPGWSNNPNGQWYWNSYLNTEYYSSFIEPVNAVTTIQMDLIGYTGTIKAQWAENYQSIWYNATESTTYYNETKTIYMNVVGWYPLLRLCFNNNVFATPNQPGLPASAVAYCTDGEVVNVQVLNGGSGYLAPPLVNIIGDGAGATAVATLGQGGVVDYITITNPGAGYWPLPRTPNPGASPNPVPASQQGAIVVVNTGFVTNLKYR